MFIVYIAMTCLAIASFMLAVTSDAEGSVYASAVTGAFVFVCLSVSMDHYKVYQCEKDLQRSESCTLIAVPLEGIHDANSR